MKIYRYTSVASTQDKARQLLTTAPSSFAPFVVSTQAQTAGRGRRGNIWAMPPENFAATYVFPLPSNRAAAFATYAASIAVLETLETFAAIQNIPETPPVVLHLKWPNDILSSNGKIAGILIEMHPPLPPQQQPLLLIGIGINVKNIPQNIPYPVDCLATYLPELTAEMLLIPLADTLKNYWQRWQQTSDALLAEAWLEKAGYKNKQIVVKQNNSYYTGLCTEIDAHGRLKLCDATGTHHTFTAGEITTVGINAFSD